jgi:uncharacterized protein YdhG (YjbR/CyaY superfamily)
MAAPASVDDYLADLPEAARAAMEGLRRTIRAAAPDASESISYAIPTYKVDGRMLVSIAAFKNHFSVFPASAVVREAIGAELEPYVAGQGTIRFPAARPIPQGLVTRIVEARLAEVAARGGR